MNQCAIKKEAKISGLPLDERQMEEINQFTLSPLSPEQVYAFKVTMCDNEVDRDFEVFPKASLERLAALYVGKTVICDHKPESENQRARIYHTEVVSEEGKTATTGEPYTRLLAYCYMLRNEGNKQLIEEINAGIKKEVSVGCSVGRVTCSVCGKDRGQGRCSHIPGKSYEGAVCAYRLEEPTDAYELSFVAVPAQPRAGVTKQRKEAFKDREIEQLIEETNKLLKQTEGYYYEQISIRNHTGRDCG